jgi:hypothetical protein
MSTERERFDADIAAKTAATRHLVEADDFSRRALWEGWVCDDYPRKGKPLVWEQQNPGVLTTIGHVNGLPVCVCLTWAKIEGAMVCFYDVTSRMVDWSMVDEWRAKTFPNVPKVDAANFHNFVIRAREWAASEAKP